MKRFARTALVVAAAVGLAGGLAGCGSSDEQAPPPPNMEGIDIAPDNGVEANVVTEAPAANRIDNLTAETPHRNESEAHAKPAVSETEQVQDDAAATGMTARVAREDSANETEAGH